MTGELAALTAACLWAVASLIYARLGQRVPPLALNVGKGGVAIAFLLLTILVQGQLTPQVSIAEVGLLSLSGLIGIGFGDSVYLSALRDLGARRTLLLEALAPVMAAGGAWVTLQETLMPIAWLGMGLTIGGVAWVISERTDRVGTSRHWRRGIICGLLAASAQATGAVLSRAALADTPVSPLWGALIRLGAGVSVVLLWGGLQGQLPRWQQALATPQFLRRLLFAAFMGTYLTLWLQQISLKSTGAGVAQTLSSTSPIFVLPLVIWLGERVSWRAGIGAIVALGGIALLCLHNR